MYEYPKCPKCGENTNVKQLELKTSASLRVALLHVEAFVMDLTTPIGKGASVHEAQRLRLEAKLRKPQDYRYQCKRCDIDFEYGTV